MIQTPVVDGSIVTDSLGLVKGNLKTSRTLDAYFPVPACDLVMVCPDSVGHNCLDCFSCQIPFDGLRDPIQYHDKPLSSLQYCQRLPLIITVL